ncbi:MAG: ccmC [Deltaproteobacteria bacterium]|nr:ccmC [Deltaproteobacteria bacterium]
MKEKLKDALALVTAVLVVSALYMVFVYAPADANMGNIQRIFYFHVSFAWTGFIAFFGTFVGSLMYLIRKKRFWDILAVSSAEIGIAFCLVVLTTGPIWARPVWGAWWTWDPRLVTFLILTFMFVAYMIVRGAIEEETKRGRFSAVIGIIAFLNVPLTYVANVMWRTIHPDVIRPDKIDLDPRMIHALFMSLSAITLLYVILLLRRMDLEGMRDRVAELKKKIMKEA